MAEIFKEQNQRRHKHKKFHKNNTRHQQQYEGLAIICNVSTVLKQNILSQCIRRYDHLRMLQSTIHSFICL